MPAFRILARGDWRAGAIRVEWVPSTLAMPPVVAESVERAWSTAIAQPGIHLFDGPLCRFESWRQAPSELRLSLSRTSYKPFLGTNGRNPGFADIYGPQAMANAVGTSAAIRTADGVLAFGVRDASMALYPDCAHPFGGCLEPRDDLDVFVDLARELREEAGVAGADLSDLRCLALAEDLTLRQPELMCVATTRLDLAELRARLDPAEHRGIWTVPAEAQAIVDVLRREARMTPLTRLTLLLVGTQLSSDPWFESAIGAGWSDGNAS
jgi:hypothetical protein